MINKEFLEEFSLFRKQKLDKGSKDLTQWRKIAVNMNCHVCNSQQTFNMTNEYFHLSNGGHNNDARNRVLDLQYFA